MRCSRARRCSAALLCVLACAAPVVGQGDPLELQRRAVQRIDGFVDQVRRGADVRIGLAELALAERELAASNLALAARGDWAALAVGLIKQGHISRMQSQWPNAIAFYQQAFALDAADVNVSTDLGTALWYSGRPDEALAQYDRSLAISPAHAQTLYNIGIVRADGKHDYPGAATAWEKLLETSPAYPHAAEVRQLLADARLKSSLVRR